MPNVGDVVLYVAGGKSYNAIVLASRNGEVSHEGADSEPLLDLAFIAPERESKATQERPGYKPQVFIEYDVVHASHEFSEEYKREKGLLTVAQIASHRGAGEWVENAPASDAVIDEAVSGSEGEAVSDSVSDATGF